MLCYLTAVNHLLAHAIPSQRLGPAAQRLLQQVEREIGSSVVVGQVNWELLAALTALTLTRRSNDRRPFLALGVQFIM
jgi:hypothetical protein